MTTRHSRMTPRRDGTISRWSGSPCSRTAAAAFLLAAALAAGSCTPPVPISTEVEALRRDAVPSDPSDAAWRAAPVYAAQLIPQDLVEPRLLEPSTSRLEVRALTDGRQVALRLTWSDRTRDDLPVAARFTDACAIQIPQKIEPDVPDPQMGGPGRPVEITFWRAAWQAAVDGRPDTIRSIHPFAVVDHYPFEAQSLEPGSPEQRAFEKRYAPADAAGNRREGPRRTPVEDLLAEGPGTIHPLPAPVSSGLGRRTEGGWDVVIVRPLPAGLADGARTQIAFGVWDGNRDEVGSRKMRTGWVPFSVRAAEAHR